MSTMKADVTAENKPAYSQPDIWFTQRSGCMQKNTHKHQRTAQVFVTFLDKITVMFVDYVMEFVVKFDGGVTGCPQQARKESWQCFKHSILQAENSGKICG